MSIEKKSEQQPFSSSVTTTAKLPVWPAVGGATGCLNYNGSNWTCVICNSDLKHYPLIQSQFILLSVGSLSSRSSTLEVSSVGALLLVQNCFVMLMGFQCLGCYPLQPMYELAVQTGWQRKLSVVIKWPIVVCIKMEQIHAEIVGFPEDPQWD